MSSVGIPVYTMPKKLVEALNTLGISSISVLNDQGKLVRFILPKEHTIALFLYLELAGYLSPNSFNKAIAYLSEAKPFGADNETICKDFALIYKNAHENGIFNVEYFLNNFFDKDYFNTDDIVDLIVFLQQTAFDRQFGVERDKLQAKPWLEAHQETFCRLATDLGVVTPLPPRHENYCGTAIMGAASTRVKARIQYFNSLSQNCGNIWALSGNRELSKGLDEQDIMTQVAIAAEKPVIFVKKGAGAAEREYLEGVTETMMVNYLLRTLCNEKRIAVIESKAEEGHWRTTTAQGAKDIAKILVQKIKDDAVFADKEGIYRFMIIAEQPYAGRMAIQVQRAFDAEIVAEGLDASIKIEVEGVGLGIKEEDLCNITALTRINSELAALMAERYTDARSKFLLKNPNLKLRDPKILMFNARDNYYTHLTQSKAVSESTAPRLCM